MIQTKNFEEREYDYEYISQNEFWIPKYTKNGNFDKVEIDVVKFSNFLYRHGFRRYDLQDDSIFIQIVNDRIFKPIQLKHIQDFVFNWIEEKLPKVLDDKNFFRDHLTGKFISGIQYYFNKQRLYFLQPREPIVFNKCTRSKQYFYYLNGFVEITREAVKFKKYDQLGGYIWQSEVLDRNFLPGAVHKDNTVSRFIKYVSDETKPSRERALRIAIGYYLHQYTEYKLKALVLTDGSSEADEANGRTGKTLFCRLIGHMISANPFDPSIKSYVEINGKDFDPRDKHKYSKAGPDTKLIILNDLKPYFKLDPIYNDITDFQTIDKKNMQPFNIRAKLILTKNKSIDTSGASDRDRILEFEFSNFFNEDKTPESVFNHWFFTDWNVEQWAAYDSYMCQCSRMFLENNCKLEQPEQINLTARKLKEHTPEGFLDFVNEVWRPRFNYPYECKEIYQEFLNEYPDHQRGKMTHAKFTKALKMWCNLTENVKRWDKDKNIVRQKSINTDKQERHYIILKEEPKIQENENEQF